MEKKSNNFVWFLSSDFITIKFKPFKMFFSPDLIVILTISILLQLRNLLFYVCDESFSSHRLLLLFFT